MANVQHKLLTPADNHGVLGWPIGSSATRAALVLTSADIGKMFYQDTDEIFFLKAVTPSPVWRKVVTAADASTTMYGVQSLSDTNYYQTALNTGEAGISTGFGIALLVRYDALSAGNRTIGSRFINVGGGSGNQGYEAVRINNNVMSGLFANAAGNAMVATPTYTVVSGDVGKWDVILVMHTGAGNTVRLWRASGEIGSPLACTGYTPGGSTSRNTLGRRNDITGLGASSITIGGQVAFRGVPTDLNIAAFFASVKAAGDVVDMPGATTTHKWSVKQDQTGSAPATLDDKSASDDMTAVGTPALVTDAAPTWCF